MTFYKKNTFRACVCAKFLLILRPNLWFRPFGEQKYALKHKNQHN